MLRQVLLELGPTSRVLVLKLNTGGTDRQPLGGHLHALVHHRLGSRTDLGQERLTGVAERAGAAAGEQQRRDPLRIPQREHQPRIGTHAETDQVSTLDAEAVEDGPQVLPLVFEGVRRIVLRHI